MSKEYLRFQRFGIITIVAVYLLILAGGVVRSTGSGMGCPDWPRCFGKIIPPTKESELPPDYQERYKDHGYGSTKFNVVKTWIEYVNRLLGAVIGLLAMSLFALSFAYKNKDNTVIKLSGAVLLLVIIEGIIGKYVVSTNLKPVMVSVHMWGSIVIILLLIYTVCRTNKEKLIFEPAEDNKSLKNFNILLIVLTIIQVISGTQVRQEIDVISAGLDYSQRESWIEQLGNMFYIHRSFSIVLFLTHLFFLYKVRRKNPKANILSRAVLYLFLLLMLEVIAGITLGWFDFPAFAQPVHMLLATVILGAQFFVLIILNYNNKVYEAYNISRV